MRSIRPLRARGVAALCALALLGAAGCSKKATAPNSRPVPEGQQNGQLLMMGWHEQRSVSFSIDDPGTPTNPQDDVLGSETEDFWADPAGVRTATFDRSQSNQLEPFRIGSDGNVTPMFDFFLEPSVRIIGTNFEAFDFEDFAPSPDPGYYARGVLNGQITLASPLSNRAGAFPTCDDNMDFIPPNKKPARDSTLDIRFVDDPRAAFYVVELSDASLVLGTGDVFTFNRRVFGIPSPLLPGDIPRNGFTTLIPGGFGQTGIQVTLAHLRWPLFFHLRITAFDGTGRMVNRVNDYLHTRQTISGINVETYEPLGGAVEVLDPYPDPTNPISPPQTLTRDEAFNILQTYGGGIAHGVVANLSHSVTSAPGTASPASAFSDAMRALSAGPAFSQASVDRQFQSIRAKLAPPPTPH
jgi:hypothetical protein